MSKKTRKPQENQIYRFSFRWSWSQVLALYGSKPLSNLEDFKRAYEHIKSTLNDICEDYIFQLEMTIVKPDNHENWHYQGFLKLSSKDRPKSLAKKLNAHLFGVEISAASNAGTEALKKYCIKSDTKKAGPWAKKEEFYFGEDLYTVPYPWQKDLETILDKPADKRTILWIYNPKGNAGKSEFTKKMFITKGVVGLMWSSTENLLNMVSKMKSKAYIFDLSKTKPVDLGEGDIYTAMECIKNGYIFNSKYETKITVMKAPHVIIFSNNLPKREKLSDDRWVIKTINDKMELVPYVPFV